jgi:hypothetical protein
MKPNRNPPPLHRRVDAEHHKGVGAMERGQGGEDNP